MTNEKKWDDFALLQLGRGFWEIRVYLTGIELGLYPLLARSPRTAKEVSEDRQTDLRATTVLLDALTAMGLLRKEDGVYSLMSEVEPYLVDDSEESVLPMAKHAANLWQRWSHLTDVVRTGKPAPRPPVTGEADEDYRAFILAMHVVSKATAVQVAARVDLADSRRLLDIGGASGTFTIAFLKAKPEMTATVFDLPGAIPLARERLTREGFMDRVTLHEGDFYEDALPGGHDLALLSAIIHQNSRQQNRDLYRKVYDALVPGGRLIIRDHVMDDSHTRPAPGALFAVNMLVATDGGGTYSFDEIRQDLDSAGFSEVTLLEKDERMNGLVEACRKG